MKQWKKVLCAIITMTLLLMIVSCGQSQNTAASAPDNSSAAAAESTAEDKSESEAAEPAADSSAAVESTVDSGEAAADTASDEAVEKNGEVIILYTSDIHCGVDQGFGLAGLAAVRDNLEADGYTTLLVDDGDAIQGEPLGTLSKGEAIVDLMNSLKYDVAIPGNHEFDYGMDQFLALTEKSEHPYISCNFVKDGEPVFDPYVVIEAAGIKIGFVGVTTPTTFSSSTPSYFQDESGNYVYGFSQDETGEALYQAVQSAVDAARAEGAEYVYLMAHLGNEAECSPWTYADVISNTNGIDVVLDGHSHDTDQIVMKNKDGEDVTRSAVGTKMQCIGHSLITPEEGISETGIWSWPNEESAPYLLGFENDTANEINAAMSELEEQLGKKIATSSVDLTISDPAEVDSSGKPIRMVRRAETNLGDFCADAFKEVLGADIGLVNGGGVRADMPKGDVTYNSILTVFPFGNDACMAEVTGQMLLDALEWGVRAVPSETGAFLHVSGISFEIDTTIPTGCIEDEYGMCTGIEGERRVKNVMVGDEPIDPEKTYTVASSTYVLQNNGDGYTAFNGATFVQIGQMSDDQILSEYMTNILGGQIGEEYADPYGQGRITILE